MRVLNCTKGSMLDSMGFNDRIIAPYNPSIIIKASASKPPTPEIIMQREKNGGIYTTVKWSDGTYTTVKACDEEQAHSVYIAFCSALAKKLYGSNSAVHRLVNRHTESYIEDEKKKAAALKRAKERAAEQAAHERALLREAKRLRLMEEAIAYNNAHSQEE